MKTETLEEFRARGGEIKRVDFGDAYKLVKNFGYNRKNKSREVASAEAKSQIHAKRLEAVVQVRKMINSNGSI